MRLIPRLTRRKQPAPSPPETPDSEQTPAAPLYWLGSGLPFFWRRLRLPPLEDAAEYQQEARLETPLIRPMGLRDSAMVSPWVLNRRYQRHCDFFATGNRKQLAVLYLIILLAGVGAAIGMFFYTAAASEARSMQSSPLQNSLIIGMAGSVIASGLCYVIRMVTKFHAAYASVWVFEAADEVDRWRTTGILRTYLPRLGFIDGRAGDFFSGPTRSSGPLKGIVHLEIPDQNRIVDLSNITDCYDLLASSSTFTEVPARETYDLLDQAVEAGEIHRGIGKGKFGKLLADNWPYAIMALEIGAIFMMSGAGQNTAP